MKIHLRLYSITLYSQPLKISSGRGGGGLIKVTTLFLSLLGVNHRMALFIPTTPESFKKILSEQRWSESDHRDLGENTTRRDFGSRMWPYESSVLSHWSLRWIILGRLERRALTCRSPFQIPRRLASPKHQHRRSDSTHQPFLVLSLIHIWRCRRSTLCRSRWSPYH